MTPDFKKIADEMNTATPVSITQSRWRTLFAQAFGWLGEHLWKVPALLGDGTPADARRRLGLEHVTIAYTERGAWQPDTDYDANDLVWWEGSTYGALVSHHSGGDFKADLDAGLWRAVGGDFAEHLGEPTGSSLAGFMQSVEGALPRTVLDKLRERFTPMDCNIPGDGKTIVTQQVHEALAESARMQRCLRFEDGVWLVQELVIPDGAIFQMANASFKSAGAGDTIKLGNNFTAIDLTVDCASISACGVRGAKSGWKMLGRTSISNLAPGGSNVNGAIVMSGCNNFEIGDLVVTNCRQDSNAHGLYRSIDLANCYAYRIRSVHTINGDINVNAFKTWDGMIGSISCDNIQDNCLYLIDDTHDFVVNSINANGCGKGIVLQVNSLTAGVHIGMAVVRGAIVQGVMMRTGGGYRIDSLELHDCDMSQATAFTPPTSNLTISTLTGYMLNNTTRRIISAVGNMGIAIGTLDMTLNAPFNSEGARFTDCDHVTIGHVVQRGIGADPVEIGVRFIDGASPFDNPAIRIDGFSSNGIEKPYAIDVSDKNIVISSGFQRVGRLELTGSQGQTIEINSGAKYLNEGDIIGRIITTSDRTSNPRQKFSIITEAAGSYGTYAKTKFIDDAGNVVGVMNQSSARGMTVVLPTSPVGLPIGSIWNNKGTISIV